MSGDRTNPGASGRVLCCASALLVLALAAQVTLGGPVAAELVRQEVAAEREAVRRWSSEVARAIREFVQGGERGELEAGTMRLATVRFVRRIGSVEAENRGGVLLGAWLLDLPPPARG